MFYTADSLRRMHQGGETVDFLFFYGHQLPSDGSTTESCLSQWYLSLIHIFTVPAASSWKMPAFEPYLTRESRFRTLCCRLPPAGSGSGFDKI